MSDKGPIEQPEPDPSSRILPGRRTPTSFVLLLILVVGVVAALLAVLLIYGPAFTSHPKGVVQSDRPQASGSRL